MLGGVWAADCESDHPEKSGEVFLRGLICPDRQRLAGVQGGPKGLSSRFPSSGVEQVFLCVSRRTPEVKQPVIS